jgi:uncharacterized protein YecA (UPF0149 family)
MIMKKKEPSSEKYPGNDWLAEKLVEHDLQFSVAYVHGIIRGSIANPMMVEPAEAIAEIFDKKKADKMSISDLEVVFMGMFALWKETAVSFHVPTTFPNAVMTRPGSGADVRTFNSDIVDLANGFIKGFSLKPIPKKYRSEAVKSWWKDINDEASECLIWYERPEKLSEIAPDEKSKRQVLSNALEWIEDCMVWLFVYSRFALDSAGDASGKNKIGRNEQCPCGSGKKYKKCCIPDHVIH